MWSLDVEDGFHATEVALVASGDVVVVLAQTTFFRFVQHPFLVVLAPVVRLAFEHFGAFASLRWHQLPGPFGVLSLSFLSLVGLLLELVPEFLV